VTLSLKGAKSPIRGRKLRSSGTKARARVSDEPHSLIELKKQLETALMTTPAIANDAPS